MLRIRFGGKLWDVCLIDDGTLDTVISIQPVAPKSRYERYPVAEMRFDGEFAQFYRNGCGAMTVFGLRALGREAADAYQFPGEVQ